MSCPLIEVYLRESIGLDASSLGPGLLSRVVRLRMQAAGVTDERAYLDVVMSNPAVRQQLIEALVVPETWFFRDRDPFPVLARLARKRRDAGQRVRVLSLPCATGEEAYTIAITLLQAGLQPGEFSVEAMDISGAALAVAGRAVYGRNSFRDGDRQPPPSWFEAADGDNLWSPIARARECVVFRQGNLFAFTSAEHYDFVFCRNLLIYFDAEMQAEAVRRLLAVLSADGVFFVGHAEAAVVLRAGLAPLPDPRSFAFVRKPVEASAAPTVPVKRTVPVRPSAPAPVVARPFADVVRPASKAVEKTPAPDVDESLDEIAGLADQGHLAEAIRLARFHLDAHGPSARAYYLMAVAHDAAGEAAPAESAYRKVLYLEPRHGEAIAQLALLLEKRGSPEAARLWQRVRRPVAQGRGGDA